LVIDTVLIRKYYMAGPHYTSYPTADFVEAFGEAELSQWLAKRNIGSIIQPISLYVHLPYCDTASCHCACNKAYEVRMRLRSTYSKCLDAELAPRWARPSLRRTGFAVIRFHPRK